MMPIVYSKSQTSHCPPFVLSQTGTAPHPDTGDRIDAIFAAMSESSFGSFVEPEYFDKTILNEIHDNRYLSFLERSSTFFSDDSYYFPLDFFHLEYAQNISVAGEFGQFSLDVCTPLSIHTYDNALRSCSVAYSAANLVKEGERVVYALCRPPGHHAMKRFMNGFCYINNGAVAAQYLSKFGKVAVLDLDFHHGNGTQDIFYTRNDVFTASIHSSPLRQPPYYWGFSEEVGTGEGVGYNLNIPLSAGITDKQYHQQLENVLTKISDFSPQYLVVALGFDTYSKDALGDFELSLTYYSEMAKAIADIHIPTLIVQEGGYHFEIGEAAVSFFGGFLK
jgi:acetoin utilization deacetylase AcuC-like enzyme